MTAAEEDARRWSSLPIDLLDERFPVSEAFPGNGKHEQSDSVSLFPSYVPGNGKHDGEEGARDLFYDVGAMLEGGLPDPPAPVLGIRSDGHGLFYGGQLNMIFGDPESGKTLLCLAACSEALNRGRSVLVIDLDHNGPSATIDRLLMFDAPESALIDRERFRYVEPEDAAHLLAVVAAAVAWRPAVVLIDSVGELMPVFGFSSNSPDDFTLVNSRVLKPLAMAGAAVLGIDHLAKGLESRTSGPTGTAAKKRAVGGVSVRVTLKDAFTPGRGGAAAITIHKDRHGGLRQHCPPRDGGEAYAGTFVLTAEPDDSTSWKIVAPELGDRAPSDVADADLAALTALDPPPASVRDVRERLKWRTTRAVAVLREWRSQERFPVSQTQVGKRETAPDPDCPACQKHGIACYDHCSPEGTK